MMCTAKTYAQRLSTGKPLSQTQEAMGYSWMDRKAQKAAANTRKLAKWNAKDTPLGDAIVGRALKIRSGLQA